MNNFNCFDCYDEGVIFWGTSDEEYDSEFCSCSKGHELENYYVEWYAESELNEYTLENA